MTVVALPQPAADAAVEAGTVIAVGVRNADADRAAIDWALGITRRMDPLHIVHAFVPRHPTGETLDDCDRRLAGKRLVREAVRYASAQLPALTADGWTIAGLPRDVLVEMSGVIDLLVIGTDHGPGHTVAAWVQARAACPVVVVPETYAAARDPRPVTLVGDDLGFGAGALEFAAALARKRHVTLQVARVWSAQLDGDVSPAWLADRQAELDASLADLQVSHPGLPVVGRIELVPGWLALARGQSSLVVADRRLAGVVQARTSIAAPCPVAIVPG